MRKIIFFISLLTCLHAFSQAPELPLGSPYQNVIQRGNFRKALILPKGTTPALNSATDSVGAVFYNTLKKQMLVYNGTTWDGVSNDSATTIVKDTVVFNGSMRIVSLPQPLNAIPATIYYKASKQGGYSEIPTYADSNYVYIEFPVAPNIDTCIYTLYLKPGGQNIATGGNGVINGSGGSFAPVIFNNSGTGASSGAQVDGTSSKTISYNTIGAEPVQNGNGYLKKAGLTLSFIPSIPSADLAATGITPGAYTNLNATVNAAGQITAIANGSGGAGSGTVNSGSANQIAYYNSTGTVVSGLTAITANKALISNASGLPIASTATNTDLDQWHLAAVAQTLTDGATITMNCANGYVGNVTIAGNRNIVFTNVPVNRQLTINVVQDATGNRSLTFPSNTYIPVGFSSATTPNLSTAASAWDILYLTYDGTNYTLQFSKSLSH